MSRPKSTSPCLVDGCGRLAQSRGWCLKHWTRWYRHGDPLGGGPTRTGAGMDFVRKAAAWADQGPCLDWPFAKKVTGHGTVHSGGVTYHAHVLVCRMAHGEKPTPLHEVAHNCGRGQCVNPHHLRWATHKENMQDTLLHGTHNRGERHGAARLSNADVAEIRRIGRTVKGSHLAARFAVSPSHISSILSGKDRKHG